MKRRILVIEDETAVQQMIRYALENADFEVVSAHDGNEAKRAMREELPDLMLVDWMLPGVSGIELVRGFRRHAATRTIPIIMLTARVGEDDKIDGLESGADDYVTKPFSTRELISRVHSLLRRAEDFSDHDATVHAGSISLDPASHEVMIGGQPVHVGPTEYRLLQFLMRHPNRVYSRGQLLDYVWGEDVYIEERTVDVHVLRLRKLLKQYDVHTMLQTVRGTGYKFSVAPLAD